MKAWLAVLLGKPASGLSVPADPDAAPLFPAWIELAEFVAAQGADEDAREILLAAAPLITPYMEAVSFMEQRKAAATLADLCRDTGMREDVTADILLSCGAAAETEYAEFLLDRHRYREWAAWHHLNRSGFDRVEMTGLKTLIEEAPMEAIYLCHTHVTEQIALRNRMNYKEAVRVLKKMKRAAKKAGRADWWNEYLAVLRKKHSRLRALMEEMERGKLTL